MLTNSRKHEARFGPSVHSLWVWSINKWFDLACVIVDLRYVFIHHSAEALLSLTTFVVGVTRISFSKVHISEKLLRWAGERDWKYFIISEIVTC